MSTLYQDFPNSPGVYLMRDKKGKLLYVGKAGNLRRRVQSYFVKAPASPAGGHDGRIERLVQKIHRIEYEETGSALEALVREAELIKRHMPPYNVREKDDTSFLYIEITRDAYPQVCLVRGKQLAEKKRNDVFGPFIYPSEVRVALKILRRIFPYSTHPKGSVGTYARPCLDAEMGLCPGTCTGEVDRTAYLRNIRALKQVLRGRTRKLLRDLERDMHAAADAEEFERAAEFRRQIFALKHINDVALVGEARIRNSKLSRIEGYDISTISGTFAVGVMVVFNGDEPSRDEYRKFRIRTIRTENDVGMLQEVFRRRFRHSEWPMPNILLVDGGKPQISAARGVLREAGLELPVIGIAKGPTRRKNEFMGDTAGADKKILIRIRDEAHRFAQAYHRELRSRAMTD